MGPRTLSIDIGGTGLKAMIVSDHGEALTERVRVPTPRPATPDAVLSALTELVAPLGDFDRVSIGFPGVVADGLTLWAPNLHEAWRGFPLSKAMASKTGRPVKLENDAAVHGYAVIERKGLEILLTLGTGFGSAVYLDGRHVPNLEIGHRPFRKGYTYDEYVGRAALDKVGKKKWNKRVVKVIEQALRFKPRRLFIGGGNAKHLDIERLPPEVTVVPNIAGLLGGPALW
jgi:polyphosphate glucokinase